MIRKVWRVTPSTWIVTKIVQPCQHRVPTFQFRSALLENQLFQMTHLQQVKRLATATPHSFHFLQE